MTPMSTTPGWPNVKLGDLGDALIGLTYSPTSVRDAGTLVLRSSNIQDGRLVFDDNVYVDCAIPNHIRVREHDILMCARNGSRRLIGKSVILDDRIVGETFGAFMVVFRSPYNSYLRHYFQSDGFRRQIDEHLGATINQITNGSLKGFQVALPDEGERAKISKFLDDADTLVVSLERLIVKKQAIKQGMMQQLLTGKVRLPGFNRPWTEVRLGDHVSYIKTVALSRAQLDSQSPLRYLHYGDIHGSTLVTLDAAHHEMPRTKSSLARNAGHLQVGDLVFADASEDQDGVGKSVEIVSVPKEGVIPGLHTIAARFNKSVLANGFTAYLQFNPRFRSALLRLAAGTKVLATTRSYISSIQLFLPAVDEQRAIAQVLLDADEEVSALKDKLDKARAIRQGMMQELLTGRTRLPVKEPAV